MRFSQVNVFSSDPLLGNPVAVVHDADGVSDQTMAAFARWTNLSETTFLLSPTTPEADYRLRIFTPGGELPFAGHPTLGSCRAWLDAGGSPRDPVEVVQECAAGLVPVRVDGDMLAFKGPPLTRSGPVSDADLAQAAASVGLNVSDVVDANWLDNGPGWLGLVLESAQTVLGVQPRAEVMGDLKIGVIGPHTADRPADNPADNPADYLADFEVRAFAGGIGVDEDPVTGSLNAGFGMWLIGTGRAPRSYVARQGTAMRRRGMVRVAADEPAATEGAGTEGSGLVDVWVGGETTVTISGTITLSS